MKKFNCHFLWVLIGVFILASPCTGATRKDRLLIYDRGLVSFQAENLPLGALLERLASAAGVEIYLADKLPNRPADVSFDKRPLIDVLDSLLRGFSYAVIYSEGADGRQRVFLDLDKDQVAEGSTIELIRQVDIADVAGMDDRSDTTSFIVSSPSLPELRDGDSHIGSGLYELDGTRWQSVSGQPASSPEPSSFFSSRSTTSGYSAGLGTTGASVPNSGDSGVSGSTDSEVSGSDAQDDYQESSNVDSRSAPAGFYDDYENMSDSEKQIAQLEFQISRLEKDIESGEADRFYQHWASIKDPKYVYNHREDLAYKQQRLAELKDD